MSMNLKKIIIALIIIFFILTMMQISSLAAGLNDGNLYSANIGGVDYYFYYDFSKAEQTFSDFVLAVPNGNFVYAVKLPNDGQGFYRYPSNLTEKEKNDLESKGVKKEFSLRSSGEKLEKWPESNNFINFYNQTLNKLNSKGICYVEGQVSENTLETRRYTDSEYIYIARIQGGQITTVKATTRNSRDRLDYYFNQSSNTWSNSEINKTFSKETIMSWPISNTNAETEDNTNTGNNSNNSDNSSGKTIHETNVSTGIASSGTGKTLSLTVNPDNYKTDPTISEDSEVINVASNIVGIINVFGIIILVATIMVLGIKYMIGSTEQRAEYKKTMMPILIGAILLFGITTILNVIYNATINMDADSAESSTQVKVDSQYELGQKAAESWMKSCESDEEWEKECTRASNAARSASGTSGAEWANGYYDGIKNGSHYWSTKSDPIEQGKYNATQFLNKCTSDESLEEEIKRASEQERTASDTFGKQMWSSYVQTLKNGEKPWRENNEYKGKADAIAFLQTCKSEEEYNNKLDERQKDLNNALLSNDAMKDYLQAYINALKNLKNQYKTW